MNIKTIMREEIDDFDWIREIPSGIELKYNKEYVIDCCDSGYVEGLFKSKLEELRISSGSRDSYVNRFNNSFIREVDHKCILFIRIVKNSYEEPRIESGWDHCDKLSWYRNYQKLKADEFLTSWFSYEGK